MVTNEILSGIWPEWKIVKQIGRGSFGVVYEVVRKDYQVKSRAAIKVISIPQNESEIDSLRTEGLTEDATRTYLQGLVNEFVSEIQLMESFKGVQNIVSVEDYKVVEKEGEIGWDIYIRMELLTAFNSYIRNKTLSEREVIKLGCDICTALELCAKRQVIHRDIKPENIFINDFGDFKLGDFGIARKLENVTGGLSKKGTYNYMAPEVEQSAQYDATVDIYSLGLVLYRFVNKNRLPFLESEKQLLNPNERMAAIRRRMAGEVLPAPCDATPAMAQVILRACAYDPSQRFASAAEMKNALMRVADGTYRVDIDDFDRTVPLRKAQQDPDRTAPVRKAPQAQNEQQKAIDTFGGKKRSRVPRVAAILAAVAVLAATAVFAVPKLMKGGAASATDSEVSAEKAEKDETGNHPEDEKEQIAAILKEAEGFAADRDYKGALTKVRSGLATYPGSDALQDKEKEYTKALENKEKEDILFQASEYRKSGDYAPAVTLLKGSREKYIDDTEYQSTYAEYCEEYKSETAAEADNLAASGDYTGAIQKINDALAVLGEDGELAQKVQEYAKEQEDLAAQTPAAENSQTYNTPFYGIWCFASKDGAEAVNSALALSQKGFSGQVYDTTDWSNLNSAAWYVVTAGVYSTKEAADAALPSVQSVYPNAYVKYTGDWQGTSASAGIQPSAQQNDYAQSSNSPFYGIWCKASKSQGDAQTAAAELSQRGFDGQVFVSTDWSNLNGVTWYVVTAGVYSSKEEAEAALPGVQSAYPDAYVKYSGDWLG